MNDPVVQVLNQNVGNMDLRDFENYFILPLSL